MANNYWQGGTYHDDLPDEKSKSQVQRELLALKSLGKELLELPVKDLDKLDLSERLYESLVKAHGMTHGALKRQIGFIGGLMVHEDYDSIQKSIEKIRQTHNGEMKEFHQLEQWRDELLAGNNEVMTVLRNHFEDLDLQHLRQLVRNANKEIAQNKPPKSARLLFKYLQQCQANNDS
jgi:ribosome-associated protein